jgi:hypothetical protein
MPARSTSKAHKLLVLTTALSVPIGGAIGLGWYRDYRQLYESPRYISIESVRFSVSGTSRSGYALLFSQRGKKVFTSVCDENLCEFAARFKSADHTASIEVIELRPGYGIASSVTVGSGKFGQETFTNSAANSYSENYRNMLLSKLKWIGKVVFALLLCSLLSFLYERFYHPHNKSNGPL